MKFVQKAEWHKPNYILIHEPGIEDIFGNTTYGYSTIEGIRNLPEAVKEMRQFKKTIEDYVGHIVYTLKEIVIKNEETFREVLLKGRVPGLRYKFPINASIRDKAQSHQYKEEIIRSMDIDSLFTLFLIPITNKIVETDEGKKVHIIREVEPSAGIYTVRDQQITTDCGVIIGRMHNPYRVNEPLLTTVIFKLLGVEPLYQIKERYKHYDEKDGWKYYDNCELEGGDFLPAEDIAFIGQGLRTNEGAIKQLLDNNVERSDGKKPLLKFKNVVVIKDSFRDDSEMHLDTYFNIVGDKKVVMLEDRMKEKEKTSIVKVYELGRDLKYHFVEEGDTFHHYLKNEGFEIIPVSKKAQQKYGVNFLTIKEDLVIGVERARKECPDYVRELKNHGVEFIGVKFDEIVKHAGGPHCSTQVSRKEGI